MIHVWNTINQENQDKMKKYLYNIYGKNLSKEELDYNYSSADEVLFGFKFWI